MTTLHRSTVETIVKSRRLKMTPQRHAIVQYLQSVTHHPTADDLLKAVNEKFPMASRGTIYNTLKWLKDAGLVREVHVGGAVRIDPNTERHHHFICRTCGGVEDVDDACLSNFQVEPLPGKQKIENFEVTLRGLCAACQK
jgi:Fur family transcriptional regulator, peroxide stress response regulator